MKHLKPIHLFEWNIPGDPSGDSGMMIQNPRIPDTISIQKFSDDWKKSCKKCRKKGLRKRK